MFFFPIPNSLFQRQQLEKKQLTSLNSSLIPNLFLRWTVFSQIDFSKNKKNPPLLISLFLENFKEYPANLSVYSLVGCNTSRQLALSNNFLEWQEAFRLFRRSVLHTPHSLHQRTFLEPSDVNNQLKRKRARDRKLLLPLFFRGIHQQ